jgi:hypothetical protein
MRAYRSVLLTAALLVGRMLPAQIPGTLAPVDPARWSIIVVEVAPGAWDLGFRVDIDPGWYVYSQQSFGDMGPMPTTMLFDTLAHVRSDGAPRESGAQEIQGEDPMFGMVVKKFKGHAVFTQRLQISDPACAPCYRPVGLPGLRRYQVHLPRSALLPRRARPRHWRIRSVALLQ